MSWMKLAAILLLVAAAIVFAKFFLDDIARRDVQYLPKWVWAVIVCITIPFGAVLYLVVERDSPLD